MVNDGFVFRANCLCILVGFVRLLLMQEAHGGGLMGYFVAKKTEVFWPHISFGQR
jgi:preprotein translocase subunit SecG